MRQIIYLQTNRVRAGAFYGVDHLYHLFISKSTRGFYEHCFLNAILLRHIGAGFHAGFVGSLFLALLLSSSAGRSISPTAR